MEFLLDWMAGSFPIETDGRSKAEVVIALLESVCPDLYRETWFDSDRKIMTYNKMLSWYDKGILYLAWRETGKDTDNTNRLHLCFTSQAIQTLGYDNMTKIYEVLADNEFRSSRIDIALDTFNKQDANIDKFQETFKMFSHYGEKTVVSKILRKNFRVANAQFWDGEPRENWTVGGRTGHVYFRFYDKKLEQKLQRSKIAEMIKDGRIKPEDAEYFKKRSIYWYRIEIELKHEHAEEAFKNMKDFGAIPGIFASVFRKQIRIVNNDCPSNASLCSTASWYEEFMNILESYSFVQFNPQQNKIKDVLRTLAWYHTLRMTLAVSKALAFGSLLHHSENEISDFLEAMEKGKHRWMLKAGGLDWGVDLMTNKVYIYKTGEIQLACPIPA